MTQPMSEPTRREYLVRMRVRYQRRKQRAARQQLLDEFCEMTGYERKYALKLLNGKRAGPARSAAARRPRGAVYGAAEKRVLEWMWRLNGQPCGKRLKQMVRIFLPWYEQHEGVVEPAVRTRVLKISAAQIDRLLSDCRRRGGAKRPRPGSEVRAQVPLREHEATAREPGWMQADTVWHCGTSTAGSFVHSLLLTCTCTQWSVVRATWNRSDRVIHERMQQIEQTLPFAIKGCHTDNGGEFLNHTLRRWFKERPVPVVQTRSRPYCKNDNAHAEQKNRRLVRDFVGYDRIGHQELSEALDELLQAWSLWNNLYMPTGKLLSKTREGSKVRKVHEKPQTPCQRVLASCGVSKEAKAKLLALLEQIDPVALRREIEQKQDELRRRLRALDEAAGKRADG